MLIAFVTALLVGCGKKEDSTAKQFEKAIGQEAATPKSKESKAVFSSLSTSNTYLSTSGWAAGKNAHAEWFVPEVSGVLSAIEIAVEPSYVRQGMEKTAANLDILTSH